MLHHAHSNLIKETLELLKLLCSYDMENFSLPEMFSILTSLVLNDLPISFPYLFRVIYLFLGLFSIDQNSGLWYSLLKFLQLKYSAPPH
jgi:hypothetical protein